jgi:hypothetical protein
VLHIELLRKHFLDTLPSSIQFLAFGKIFRSQ